MKNTLLSLKKRLSSPITILGWSCSSIVLAIMGPFNTYEVQPFTGRLLFWSGILLLSTITGIFTHITIRKTFPKWHLLKRILLSVGIFTAVDWVLVCIIVKIVYAHLGEPPYILILFIIFGATLCIFSIIYLVSPQTLLNNSAPPNTQRPSHHHIVVKSSDQPPQETNNTVPKNTSQLPNSFLAQFGPDAGEHLVRLAMRDHYIEVYTEIGQKLVHMRFGDAVSQLKDENGGQVHRSHWICFDDIKDVVKDGDKMYFKMSDNALVPISRSRKPELKQRGLI